MMNNLINMSISKDIDKARRTNNPENSFVLERGL